MSKRRFNCVVCDKVLGENEDDECNKCKERSTNRFACGRCLAIFSDVIDAEKCWRSHDKEMYANND